MPSFESILHTYRALLRRNLRASYARSQAACDEEVDSIVDGIVRMGRESTKTYTQDDARHLLEDSGLLVKSVERVEYPRNQVMDDATSFLGDPYP